MSRYCSDTPAERQGKVSELPNAITRQSHFRRDCLELCTDRKKKKKKPLSALSKTSRVLLCGRAPSLFSSAFFSLSLPPTHPRTQTHKHTNTGAHTVACEEHGLGSGEVDCSIPQGFLRMKSGVMAVSTIRLMSMVYDPSGCPPRHTHTHQDEEILCTLLEHKQYFPGDIPMCSRAEVY